MAIRLKLVRTAITIFISLFPPCFAHAQSPNFRKFTTEQGLAHDSINRIARDSRGFLWFCTSDGLSRYDGKHFKNFTQDQGLPHRNVSRFLETRDGTLLVGTSYGLVLFNPLGRPYRWNVAESRLEKDSDEPAMFETFIPPDPGSRLHVQVQSLIQDTEGTIWVGTGAGLYRVTVEGSQLKFDEFKVQEPITNFANIVADARGGIVTTSGYGLYRIVQGQVETVADVSGFNLMSDRDGRIWVGTSGDPLGVRVFEFNEEGRLVLTHTYTKADGLLANTHFRALYQTSSGRIFVGGDLNGLSEFIPDAKPGEPKFKSLTREYVSALGEDPAGNLWMGTELRGAWELPSDGFEAFGPEQGIPDSTKINSIFNSDEKLFLTIWPDALMELGPDGKFQTIKPLGDVTRSWGWNYLDRRSRDGSWWMPTLHGLNRYDQLVRPSSLSTTRPSYVYTKKDGLLGDQIFNIFEDSRGDLWISTIDASSFAKWDHATNTITSFRLESPEINEKDNLPISFAEDRQGSIWIGYFFGGLTRYRDGKLRTFKPDDGLPTSQVDDLRVDSSGRLWIATTGRGVFRVSDTSAEDPVFESISTRNGLSSNQSICLAEDQFGRMYVGTGRGINRIDPQGNVRIFTQADGLPADFITYCHADANGYLWFVSRTTLVRMKATLDRAIAPPTTFIDKVSVGGVPQPISVMGETDIQLPNYGSDQHQVQIDYFAVTLGEGENIRYEYRLDDNPWSTPTDQQSVNLDLASGSHAFSVRAVRLDGTTTDKPATARFTILPPVWARWWFVLSAVVIGMVLLFGIYKYRTRHLREVNTALTEAAIAEEKLRRAGEERLAELEKVRSRIATDLHDDIGASLTQIAVLSEVARARSVGNGASEPLTKISDVSNELVESMSDIVWSINPKKDHLSDLTQRMRRFAADILSARGIGFQFNATEKDNRTVLNSNLRREMFLIYKELINNIVKHSGAKRVTIAIDVAGDFLTLEITDDGVGFDCSGLDPINVTDSQFAITLNPESKGGNGIRNMFRRAREMNGEILMDSRPQRGTTTVLRLPIEGRS